MLSNDDQNCDNIMLWNDDQNCINIMLLISEKQFGARMFTEVRPVVVVRNCSYLIPTGKTTAIDII